MSAALRLAPRAPNDPLLQRSLLLAVLLHIWLVLVFGNATGSAAPGQGVWGALTVKLLGRGGGDPNAEAATPVEARDDNGPVGSASRQRSGGQVRSTESPAPNPGAAEQGRWSPVEQATDPDTAPAPRTATLPAPEPLQAVEPTEAAPRTQRLAPTESAVTPVNREATLRETSRPAAVPLPTELPAPVNRLEATPQAPVTRLAPAELRSPARIPAEALPSPTELPPPMRRIEPPATSLSPVAPATDLRPAPRAATSPAPTAADLPTPVRRLEAPAERGLVAAQPATGLRPSPAEPSAAATPASAELPPAVKRLEASEAAGAAVTPLPRSSDLRATPAAPGASPSVQGTELPPALRRLEAADGSSGVTPLPAAPLPRGVSGAPPGGSALSELSTALPGPVATPSGPAQPGTGSPNAGPQVGHDVATPPSASTPAPRTPLNLSLPKGDIAAKRSPGLLDLLPQPPERKSEMQKKIEEATREDCRNAHADKGLLAALPLVLSPARDKGCKF